MTSLLPARSGERDGEDQAACDPEERGVKIMTERDPEPGDGRHERQEHRGRELSRRRDDHGGDREQDDAIRAPLPYCTRRTFPQVSQSRKAFQRPSEPTG